MSYLINPYMVAPSTVETCQQVDVQDADLGIGGLSGGDITIKAGIKIITNSPAIGSTATAISFWVLATNNPNAKMYCYINTTKSNDYFEASSIGTGFEKVTLHFTSGVTLQADDDIFLSAEDITTINDANQIKLDGEDSLDYQYQYQIYYQGSWKNYNDRNLSWCWTTG